MIYVPIFVENRAFLILVGRGMGVVVPEVVVRRNQHFPFPHTEFSLGTNFR